MLRSLRGLTKACLWAYVGSLRPACGLRLVIPDSAHNICVNVHTRARSSSFQMAIERTDKGFAVGKRMCKEDEKMTSHVL